MLLVLSRPHMSRASSVAFLLSELSVLSWGSLFVPPLVGRSRRAVLTCLQPSSLKTMPGEKYNITSTVELPNDPERRHYPRFGLGASPFARTSSSPSREPAHPLLRAPTQACT